MSNMACVILVVGFLSIEECAREQVQETQLELVFLIENLYLSTKSYGAS